MFRQSVGLRNAVTLHVHTFRSRTVDLGDERLGLDPYTASLILLKSLLDLLNFAPACEPLKSCRSCHDGAADLSSA